MRGGYVRLLSQCAAELASAPLMAVYASRDSSDREPEYGLGERALRGFLVVQNLGDGWEGRVCVARSRIRRLG